jgi:coenzyme F420-dependent glucose-6-phosphate dehydrogenase
MIGFHASHEQFSPSSLLRLVQQAEQAGFEAAMCSDHFHPWNERQGHSGFAWSWLGSAMQATQFSYGIVNAPCGRYHPAVIAQAVATLNEMYPDRFWLAAGSGEALNEHITGAAWSDKETRNACLAEAVRVMRALWLGDTVTHRGHVRVDEARLYTLPAHMPKVFVAALSPATARWAADWADGLITVSMPQSQLRSVVDAFREGGGEEKPMYLQVKLSYAESDEVALTGAYEQWNTNVLGANLSEDLQTPAQFEAAAKSVRPEDLPEHVRISADVQRHADWLAADLEMGFSRLYLHNVNSRQSEFIDAFGEKVLPQLSGHK